MFMRDSRFSATYAPRAHVSPSSVKRSGNLPEDWAAFARTRGCVRSPDERGLAHAVPQNRRTARGPFYFALRVAQPAVLLMCPAAPIYRHRRAGLPHVG